MVEQLVVNHQVNVRIILFPRKYLNRDFNLIHLINLIGEIDKFNKVIIVVQTNVSAAKLENRDGP